MANDPYRGRLDGVVLFPGDWLSIEGRGVGKFSGVYLNPSLGPMAYLSFYRPFTAPAESDTLFLRLPSQEHPKPETADLLARAERVAGPMKANGKRPLPLSAATSSDEDEPTEAQTKAIIEAYALLKARGLTNPEAIFMDELKKIADGGDDHARYLHGVISEVKTITIPEHGLDA